MGYKWLMLYATHARVHLDHIVANLQAVKARSPTRAFTAWRLATMLSRWTRAWVA